MSLWSFFRILEGVAGLNCTSSYEWTHIDLITINILLWSLWMDNTKYFSRVASCNASVSYITWNANTDHWEVFTITKMSKIHVHTYQKTNVPYSKRFLNFKSFRGVFSHPRVTKFWRWQPWERDNSKYWKFQNLQIWTNR